MSYWLYSQLYQAIQPCHIQPQSIGYIARHKGPLAIQPYLSGYIERRFCYVRLSTAIQPSTASYIATYTQLYSLYSRHIYPVMQPSAICYMASWSWLYTSFQRARLLQAYIYSQLYLAIQPSAIQPIALGYIANRLHSQLQLAIKPLHYRLRGSIGKISLFFLNWLAFTHFWLNFDEIFCAGVKP